MGLTTLLFGNHDVHGKSISIYVGRAAFNVAELYELVSGMQYHASELEHTLAIAVCDAFVLEEVGSFSLVGICIRCGISRSFFARELEPLSNIALTRSPLHEQDPAYRRPELELVKQIASLVTQMASALKVMAEEIPGYRNDWF